MKLIKEHIKVLRSYASVFYSQLRLKMISETGVMPMWSNLDEQAKLKYATLLEIFAKKHDYKIDLCVKRWMALTLLSGK